MRIHVKKNKIKRTEMDVENDTVLKRLKEREEESGDDLPEIKRPRVLDMDECKTAPEE